MTLDNFRNLLIVLTIVAAPIYVFSILEPLGDFGFLSVFALWVAYFVCRDLTEGYPEADLRSPAVLSIVLGSTFVSVVATFYSLWYLDAAGMSVGFAAMTGGFVYLALSRAILGRRAN